MLIWFVYIPLACIVIVVIMAYSLCVRTARRIGEISKRRASSVAFRIAVISAIFIVVVLNRRELIIYSEDATALLEFISSVVVIPLVFEWIHSAFPEKNS